MIKLHNEDCLITMSNLSNNSIDMTLTSPPYDNLREYKGYSFDFYKTANELFRITKDGGVVVWIVGDQTINGSETGTSFKQALYFKEIGFNIHDTMIYNKINYVPLTHKRYEQAFEYMFCFSKGKPKTFNPIMVDCIGAGKIEKYGLERRKNYGLNHSSRIYDQTEYKETKTLKIKNNIFSYSTGQERNGHPAPFPEQLAYDQIITWSNENDLVFDPFLGSGTTGKIAKSLNRNFIGSEIAKEYYEIAKKRIGDKQ